MCVCVMQEEVCVEGGVGVDSAWHVLDATVEDVGNQHLSLCTLAH